MRKYAWKILLILAVTAVCLWSVYPPSERVRLGKDLRGGVSLVYHVNVDRRDPDPQGALAQVISVLKERVNPRGVLDIAMQPMGVDRIEIVMPLPNAEVQALRHAYEASLEALLRQAYIAPGDLQAALDAGQAVARFGGTETGDHRRRIEELQAAHNSLKAAQEALQAAQARGDSPRELGPLEQALADAEIELDDLREGVLRLSLPRSRIERAMRLSTKREPVRDASGNQVIDPQTRDVQLAPSPRDIELDSIERSFPHLASALDSVLADYDRYAARRTGFDDPEDLMRLLRGAGVLEFHIAVSASDPQGVNPDDLRSQLDERGPENTDSMVARWFPINDLKQWYQKPQELVALQEDPITYFSGRQNLVAAERDGQYFLLLYVTEAGSMTHAGGRKWAVVKTGLTFDNYGRDAVSFSLDAPGGLEMSRLTSRHVLEPMAIVLDGQVYSAPTLQSQISNSGIIMGNFSQAELSYLIRVLAAGSLEARLTPDPIAINTLGPSVGQDNLNRGLRAFGYSLIAVAVFMILYYLFAGVVADVALLLNTVMIFGIMAFIDGTYTLPGLAGIVLTIGMAVDANVLIYERIREELAHGEELRAAIRLGYAKALSAILDSNLTTLLVCGILLVFATTEVKGFALTLMIGLTASLFTALFVTRVIFDVCTDVFRLKRLPMLATAVPLVRRLLEPNINWIGLRKAFWTASSVVCIASVIMVAARGVSMFDTEFRGGVAVMVRTAVVDEDRDGKPDRLDANGEPLRRLLPHSGAEGAEGRIKALAGLLDAAPGDGELQQKRERLLSSLQSAGVLSRAPQAAPSAEADAELEAVRTVLRELARASVLTVGRTEVQGGVIHGTSFYFKVPNPKGIAEEKTTTDVIVAAIVAEFGDDLDVTRPLSFDGAGSSEHAARTFPILKDTLGENIERPKYRDDVGDFLGGVLVVIDSIDPPATTQDLEKRIAPMRSQPEFDSSLGREVRVFGLEPADPGSPGRGYVSAAVAVYEPDLPVFKADFDLWDRELARGEWQLVSAALQRATSLEQVNSFSSAAAATLRGQAVVSVVLSLLVMLIYIWVRFGSLRYSAAAILALVHDTTVALGAIALSHYISGTAIGSFLLIEEFRIDLGVVAALLTIIGYSLNDTIVILDRIRENRGKLQLPTALIVNNSINQTFSRTVLTSWTTVLATLIMYVAGGTGIRAFAYCLLVGLFSGTYSTVAIAAPLLVRAAAGEARGGASPERAREQATRNKSGLAPEATAV